jgi:hypothetical protein
MHRIEKLAGLPSFDEVRQTTQAVNSLMTALNDKRLNSLRQLTDNLLKLQEQGGPQGMQSFIQILNVLANVPETKFDKIDSTLRDVMGIINSLQRLVKSLPEGMLSGLSLSNLMDEIKKQ